MRLCRLVATDLGQEQPSGTMVSALSQVAAEMAIAGHPEVVEEARRQEQVIENNTFSADQQDAVADAL